MRGCQQHGIDGAVGDHGVEIVGQIEMVQGAEIAGAPEIGLHRAGYLEAGLGGGFDQVAAPAAQSHDRAMDHLVSPVGPRAGRIASITAALSASPPSSRMAARSKAAWVDVIGSGRLRRLASCRINSASFRVWAMCDCGAKSRVSILRPLLSITLE